MAVFSMILTASDAAFFLLIFARKGVVRARLASDFLSGGLAKAQPQGTALSALLCVVGGCCKVYAIEQLI